MIADDVVLVGENAQKIEDQLERRRKIMERNGLKISQVKMEFMEFGFRYIIREGGK